MTKGKFALGTIVGAAIGLVAGVLTAPKSGKETRAELKTKADVLRKDATQKVEQVQTKANGVADDVKGRANETAQDVKARAEELKIRAERAVEGARKGFNSDVNGK